MKVFANVHIEGIKNLLINTFPIEALDAKKPKSGSAGNSSEEWKKTVLVDKETNKLFIFQSYLFKSISDGGKEIKVGKATIAKKVAASLEIVSCEKERIYFENDICLPENLTTDCSQKVFLDIRSVVNPMTKGRNLRYRVCISHPWELKFKISWDNVIISKETMMQAIVNGGLYQGIGDGRAIGFGRYKLVNFEEIKD